MSLLFSIVLEVFIIEGKEKISVRGIHRGKEKVKLSLFANNMKLYLGNHKDSKRRFLEAIDFIVKWQATTAICKSSWLSYIQILEERIFF